MACYLEYPLPRNGASKMHLRLSLAARRASYHPPILASGAKLLIQELQARALGLRPSISDDQLQEALLSGLTILLDSLLQQPVSTADEAAGNPGRLTLKKSLQPPPIPRPWNQSPTVVWGLDHPRMSPVHRIQPVNSSLPATVRRAQVKFKLALLSRQPKVSLALYRTNWNLDMSMTVEKLSPPLMIP
jgi:hypothetical protein